MSTAPNPFIAAPGDLSATLLRLRAAASEVARRRVFAALRQPREAAPPHRASRLRGAMSPATALVGLAVAVVVAVGYGYVSALAPLGRNLAAVLGVR